LIGSQTLVQRGPLLAAGFAVQGLIRGAGVGETSFRRREELTSIGSILCSTDVLCLQGVSWCMRERFFESGLVESIRSSERL
jgi:hypothetical protein